MEMNYGLELLFRLLWVLADLSIDSSAQCVVSSQRIRNVYR